VILLARKRDKTRCSLVAPTNCVPRLISAPRSTLLPLYREFLAALRFWFDRTNFLQLGLY
jgi:hypothetical protein